MATVKRKQDGSYIVIVAGKERPQTWQLTGGAVRDLRSAGVRIDFAIHEDVVVDDALIRPMIRDVAPTSTILKQHVPEELSRPRKISVCNSMRTPISAA
jgi:hypothetical protein